MNRQYALFHLREALEELTRTVNEIEADKNYREGEFYVAMTHLYHHLNTAWNARAATATEAQECSDANFSLWRQFPADIDLSNEPSV